MGQLQTALIVIGALIIAAVVAFSMHRMRKALAAEEGTGAH